MPTSCRYIRAAKLFLKQENIFTFVKRQTVKKDTSNDAYDDSLLHLDDVIILPATREEAKLLGMLATMPVNNPSLSSCFHAQWLYHFRKSVLTTYYDLQNCLKCVRAINHASYISSVVFSIPL